MSTHKITPETKVPFPCWLEGTAVGRWRYFNQWLPEFTPHEHGYLNYSTNPPDQRPEEVPEYETTPEDRKTTAEFVSSHFKDPIPAPSLRSVAEAAAKAFIRDTTMHDKDDIAFNECDRKDLATILTRHFAPLLAQTVRRGAYDHLAAQYRKLEQQVREMEEDKAALDWLEATGHETLAMQYPNGSRVYWVRGFLEFGDFPTLRTAIRAARAKENQQ